MADEKHTFQEVSREANVTLITSFRQVKDNKSSNQEGLSSTNISLYEVFFSTKEK
jgi:hypothetical protein